MDAFWLSSFTECRNSLNILGDNRPIITINVSNYYVTGIFCEFANDTVYGNKVNEILNLNT